MSKVYVGNLSWATTDSTLESAFSEYGTVNKAAVERDRDTSKWNKPVYFSRKKIFIFII